MRIIFLLLAMAVFIIPAVAQEPAASNSNNPPTASDAQPMGEDDRLPFMEREAAESRNAPSTGGMLVRTIGAMALIVGLIFGAAWGLKKFGLIQTGKTAEESPDLTVLSSVSLGTNRTISVVKFGERTLLVGSTAQSFTLLAEDAPATTSLSPTPRSVAELLAENESFSFGEELEAAALRLDDLENERSAG